RVADAAPVRLRVRDERGLLPVLELDFEHARERALRRLPIRKRMVGEGPGMALAPEAVQERVHVLDERAAVELGGQESVQLAEGVLEEGMVVAWLQERTRLKAGAALPLAAAQGNHGHL